MDFISKIKDISYHNCHLLIFGLIFILLLIFLFVINMNNNTNNAVYNNYDNKNANENYDNVNNNKLILYYASWCGWSQKFLPVWDDFKKQHPDVSTDMIECTNNSSCGNIKGYPTIIYYKNGNPIIYTGDRSINDLYSFVQNQINNNGSQAVDDLYQVNNKINTQDDIGYSKKTLVLYHADWCGHCKHFLPVWKKFVSQYPNIKTDSIECSNEANKAKCANIEGFPTVLLYVDGKPIQYNGDRTIDGLYNFVQNN